MVSSQWPTDYHLHSNYSPDSQAPLAEMAARAAQVGLSDVLFAEHQEYHPLEGESCRLRADEWFAELARLNDELRGRLVIRAGLELGQPHRYAAEARPLIEAYPFDAVIGSLHYVDDGNVFGDEYFAARTPEQAYRPYFEELARMAAVGGFDILAHLDGIKRQGVRRYRTYDIRPYEEPVRETYRALIANGIALEVNTRSVRWVSEPHPPLVALRWYRELGGELLTLGSDAHSPRSIAAGFDLALAMIREAGFTRLTTFHQRRAHWIEL